MSLMIFDRSRMLVLSALAGAALLGDPALLHAAVRYVDVNATGANNGTTWANAYTSLQAAMIAAGAGDEVWVAQGTYKPAGPGGLRTATIPLKNGVTIYGGFPAGGGAFGQRDPLVNVTTLSGDLNGNDAVLISQFDPTKDDNSYHIVT